MGGPSYRIALNQWSDVERLEYLRQMPITSVNGKTLDFVLLQPPSRVLKSFNRIGWHIELKKRREKEIKSESEFKIQGNAYK